MKIHSVSNYTNIYGRKNNTAFKSRKVFDDGEYVQVPREKYYREQILGWIITGWLLIDLIRSLKK